MIFRFFALLEPWFTLGLLGLRHLIRVRQQFGQLEVHQSEEVEKRKR